MNLKNLNFEMSQEVNHLHPMATLPEVKNRFCPVNGQRCCEKTTSLNNLLMMVIPIGIKAFLQQALARVC